MGKQNYLNELIINNQNLLDAIDKIIARGKELKTLQGHDRLQYLIDLQKKYYQIKIK